ncbi:unnamed protein product, partial [Rotaria sp. Silwood2]
MVRKKSISSKVKTRKEAYKRREKVRLDINRSWRILILTVKAFRKFLSFKHTNKDVPCVRKTLNISKDDLIHSSCVNYRQNTHVAITCYNSLQINAHSDDQKIVKDIVNKIVSRVCRRDNERKRQLKNRKEKIKSRNNVHNEISTSKLSRQSYWLKKKTSHNASFRVNEYERLKKCYHNKYQNNIDFRSKEKTRSNLHILTKYHAASNVREKIKSHSKKDNFQKYHNDKTFREKIKAQSKDNSFYKYHNNTTFRNKIKTRSKIHILNKYHNNSEFRNEYKARSKKQVSRKYKFDSMIRLKTIERAMNWYHKNNTLTRQNSRRLYNQRRRILKKYAVVQSRKCIIKHKNLYMNTLNRFRQITREGPDYVCISCQLTLFRNQVIPFVEEKYIKQNMSYEIIKHMQSYFKCSSSTEQTWICKSCSDKIKKQQMPSRSLLNKLEVCDIPSELKKLNNLEKHLIALRLPFMKIVNLTSGKLSSRLAQKGTKGPLHCVPSDVQDTVTALPRPIDKSMMVRLQLKRRIKYKAIWEEQLINPNDVRDALFVLTKMHPGYKSVKINDIHENYLTSDQEKNYDNNIELVVEPMDVDTTSEETVIEKTEVSNENNLKRLALGDIDNNIDSDEEINEDEQDIRTKYNIGTDSCTQPCDFNDFLVFDKEPCVVAPAEKNKLSSLLTDKTIEALAFPHLFPDGQGSYDEDRQTILRWKEYCKARLFSSDSRFASDSSYIFYLQYLGDLKQVYSGINIAFRKKLPMNAKQSLDEMQMKFLMKKDMIYRHLQCVRGSPQYWH